MKVIGDLHLGKVQDTVPKNGYPSRAWDLSQRVNEVIATCIDHGESLVLVGDIFDSTHPSPWMIDMFLHFIRNAHGIDVFVLLGNHDCGVEYHSLQYVKGLMNNVHLIDRPQFRVIDGMKCALLPHMPRVWMEKINYDYQTYALSRIKEAVDVVMGHAHITGATNASDVEFEAGDALKFDPSDFFKFQVGVFGHIHKHQTLRGGKIVYTGPVVTNSFDEAELIKGYVDVERQGSAIEWTFQPYVEPETEYAHVIVDLVRKNTLDLSQKKLTELGAGKLLKISVYAKDLMMVNEGEIRTAFKEVGGQVMRFETINCSKVSKIGKPEDIDEDEVFGTIDYSMALKTYVLGKEHLSVSEKRLASKLGSEIVTEVLDAERIAD